MSGSTDGEILTIEQAAQLMGVSVKTFNKVLHTQSIPARKIGREWKFSRKALIDWIGSGRSDDFYRESEPRIVVRKPTARDGDTAGQRDRRTSGWRLELD